MSKILVIGDALIDTNVVGSCDRLSPEGPWPVVRVSKEYSTLGGAANVAAHIANAGVDCLFAYKRSTKEPQGNKTGEVFDELLSKFPITPVPLSFDGTFAIPTKKRILAGTHQICRIDYEDTSPPDKAVTFDWYTQLTELIEREGVSIIAFSDYDKGTLTDDLIQMLANYCFTRGIMTLLDPKRPSFVKLKRLTVIKPNGKEIPATNMTANDISWTLKETTLINTIGAEGVRVWLEGVEVFKMPSVATNVVDVCGAGDSFHSVLSIALFKGHNMQQAVAAGNMASAFAISNRGTYVLTHKEIEHCLLHGQTYVREN